MSMFRENILTILSFYLYKWKIIVSENTDVYAFCEAKLIFSVLVLCDLRLSGLDEILLCISSVCPGIFY